MLSNRNSRIPDTCKHIYIYIYIYIIHIYRCSKLYFRRECPFYKLVNSGCNNISTFPGCLSIGRSQRRDYPLLILTEVVHSLNTLILQLKFIIDYTDYAVLQTDS